jgi:hypothetical protein
MTSKAITIVPQPGAGAPAIQVEGTGPGGIIARPATPEAHPGIEVEPG